MCTCHLAGGPALTICTEMYLPIQQLPPGVLQYFSNAVFSYYAAIPSYYAAIPLCALHSSSSARNQDINSKSLEYVAFVTRGLSE